MEKLAELKALLDGLNPALWPIAVVLALWGGQWAVRRWLPKVWEWAADLPFRDELTKLDVAMRKVWQALPSVIGGAVMVWLAGGGDLLDLVAGAMFGVIAPIFHELLKAAPIPYRGGKPPAAEPKEA